MNCEESTQWLHAYLDQELDLEHSLEIEKHVRECPACAARYEQQTALRKAIAGGALYFSTPPELRERVRSAMPFVGAAASPGIQSDVGTRREASPSATSARRRAWDLNWLRAWWLAPAAVAVVALVLAAPLLFGPSADTRLARQIVSAHARSLMAEHLTDVASTDQHTVKPWFNGKLTFSPPVIDLAAQGFPLVGGRLDVIEEQPVAALVYQRRKHFINLFIWPAARAGGSAEKVLAQRGYHLIHWRAVGMDCWAVSDVSPDELQRFAQLVRGPMLQSEGKTP